MVDDKVQVAEFAFPFPAKIFEKELMDNNVDFETFTKSSGEGGSDACIFYVSQLDFEIAFKIREKVDKENADAELKHQHPIVKVIGYAGLLLVFYLLIKNVLKLFSS